MSETGTPLTQATLDALFPADRADAFFDALYGDAEDGAYDIALVLHSASADTLRLAFELRQRPGKCLVCSLTYGLPQVFQRHPIINLKGLVAEIATQMGWQPNDVTWNLGRTEEHGSELHCIPLTIQRQG